MSNTTKNTPVTPIYLNQAKALFLEFIKTQQNIMTVGRPGIGKTEFFEELAEELGFEMLILHLVTSDPTDVKGFPVVVDGKPEFIPFGDLRKMMDTEKPLIVFFDDLGQAAPAVQASIMQIIGQRAINGHKISDKVSFVAATNRKEDRAGVSMILEPLQSRTWVFNIEADFDSWVKWAERKKISPVFVQLVKRHRDWIESPAEKPAHRIGNMPNPRNVAAVGKVFDFINTLPDVQTQQAAYAARLGDEAAIQITTFMEHSNKVPSIEEVLKNPEKAKLPKELDARYYMLGLLQGNSTLENANAFCKYINRMGKEFTMSYITYLERKDDEYLDELFKLEEVFKFYQELNLDV